MPKHVKGHDKDKYYHLAKDQGFRARSAFKLIQINKRFNILSKARVCLDLCAAPGGWCQVAAKEMPQGSLIIGVDLLPIRAIKGVQTLVNDITTAECRRNVANLLTGWKCDVVLCDGAPNIGANYQKDAYVQNELVLAALKTATDHLAKGGTFCTKVYRSVDYDSLIWVFQQFFEDVQAIKPNSSRSQSSEIFIVCLKYLKPDKIDPKFMDPNHVFKTVADKSSTQGVDVMNKKYEKANKRKRGGYEDVVGGVLLVKKGTVSDFVNTQEPLRVLTDVDSLEFSTDECEEYRSSKFTTAEIVECFKDLRILGKGDFKKLLKWRTRLRDLQKAEKMEAAGPKKSRKDEEAEKAETEDDILDRIMEDRAEAMRQDQRNKKKKREKASKERMRQTLGITNASFGVDDDQDLFAFSQHARGGAASDKFLKLMNESAGVDDSSDDDSLADHGGLIQRKGDLDGEIAEDYRRYGKYKDAKEMKSKKGKDYREEDFVGYDSGSDEIDSDADSDTDDDNDSSEDNDYNSIEKAGGVPDEDEEGDEQEDEYEIMSDSDDSDDSDGEKRDRPLKRSKGQSRSVGAGVDDEANEQWLSHPMFKENFVGEEVDALEKAESKKGKEKGESREVQKVIAEMPKTDKEERKEKRKKMMERKERKEAKKVRQSGVGGLSSEIDIAVADTDDSGDESDSEQPKVAEDGTGFEIAPSDYTGGMDDDDSSDDSGYDSEEKARALALGTLALRGSKKRTMIEDSHGRYSWGDAKTLPDWFNHDEKKHMKKVVSIPMPLLKTVKGKGATSGGRDIKKVAEAKARKKKRAEKQLRMAKKSATALAENSEMSDKQKLRAIQKAMKGSKVAKPGKVYVVAKKNGSTEVSGKGGSGKFKFVDKRMKSDMKRGSKKQREKAKKAGGNKSRGRR